jgi:hypothetical protein
MTLHEHISCGWTFTPYLEILHTTILWLHTASQARILKEPNVSGVDPASAQRLLERLDVFTDWDLQDCEVEAFEPR